MDSLALQCKKKLETFRIKELKDVLTRIGAAKQGKKQVLVEKIMGLLLFPDGRHMNPIGLKLESLSSRHSMSREDVAKVIDDIYSRMRKFGTSDLASNAINLKTEPISFPQTIYHDDIKPQKDSNVRCPCGKQLPDKLVQCHDCLVWQHVGCVIVSEKDGMKTETPVHFCEICRIQRGDPFCCSVSHPMQPAKTVPIRAQAEGGSAIFQKLDTRFILSQKDTELLKTRHFELQIWCVLLDDDVAFRMHWPLKPELRVNGHYIRLTNRQPQQKLGVNGRDDGPVISDQTGEGYNIISFTAHDTRNFCIGVRIIQRLSLDQILARIPREGIGESFDDALARVRRCVGGAGAGDDSDSDLEIVSENVTVNLCCPMSGSRMKIAGRFKPCVHMGCFDLHTFVELNQRARKWQCPICLKNYSLNDLIIDPYFNRVAKALHTYGEDVTEVEIKPDGFWRPKLEGDSPSLEVWHSPYGIVNLQSKSSDFQEVLSTVKVEEEFSNEKIQKSVGLKRTREDSWHLNDMTNLQIDGCESLQRRPRSQSSIGITSNDDSSVNQQTVESFAQIQIPRNEIEVNSMPLDSIQSGWTNKLQTGFEESEIIILSDTEEEILNGCNLGSGRLTPVMDMRNIGSIASSEYDRGLIDNGAGTVNPIQTEGIFPGNTSAPLDFFGISRGHEEPLDYWTSETQNGSFELFSSGLDTIASSNCRLLNTTHAEPVCSLPNSQSCSENHLLERTYPGYYEEPQNAIDNDYQHHFIHNSGPSPDQSLRNFLPHQPAKSVDKPLECEPLKESGDGFQEWISLRLAVTVPTSDPVSGACNPVGPSTPPANDLSDERTTFDPLLDSASVLLDLSNHIPRPDDNMFIQRNKGTPASFTSNHQINFVPIDSDSD